MKPVAPSNDMTKTFEVDASSLQQSFLLIRNDQPPFLSFNMEKDFFSSMALLDTFGLSALWPSDLLETASRVLNDKIDDAMSYRLTKK